MSFCTLIVRVPPSTSSYVLKLERDLCVSDLCCEIGLKIPEAKVKNPLDYGIFVADPDPKHSFWLDNSRMLSYYHLCDNSEVEYRSKLRRLVIQTIDGTRKVLQVDDSKTVAEIMDRICSKMGITNHEEYSLIRPMTEEERMRTLTLRKHKGTSRDQDKLEKMKQKLHTDDELNWLAHGKSLRQQGVEESEIILLRRKYFFSDQNVDTRDPVQLNLLYIQLKEAILNGAHPISIEQAIQLAALQCQSEIGVYTPEKAKHQSIDLKEHLPKEYRKVKGVEKRIQEAHKKLRDYDEREAQLQYIQLCRSLPTYGITFFLIKEKLKGRNKLVPRLFGVSKESVMRVDENTKDILETWPLTRIHRWAAGPNLFTLDFGQYRPDGNYAMQTTEGEQIGQLISGYIDIILRRQKGRQAILADGDEESTIVEENVEPSRANVISNINGTLPRGKHVSEAHIAHGGNLHAASRRGDFSEGHLATRGQAVIAQHVGGGDIGSGRIVNRNGITQTDVDGNLRQAFQVIDLEQPKRALRSRVDFGLRTIKEAAEELDTPIYPDDDAIRGDDATTKRWRVEALEQARNGVWSHLGAMTMATGQLISCLQIVPQTPPSEGPTVDFDYTNMDASLASIGMNVHGLMQCVRLYDQIDLANNDGVDGQASGLKEAAQALSDAFLELMRATVPAACSEGDLDKTSSLSWSSSSLAEQARTGPDRVALLEAASRVGDASRQLLLLISQPTVHSMNAHVETVGPQANGQFVPQPVYPSVIDWEARDRLLSATKAVTNRMAQLVKTAKKGAMDVGQEAADLAAKDPAKIYPDAIPILRATQTRLVQAATAAGKCASRLVTCAKVVVCTMEQPESQDQLILTAKEVAMTADKVAMATEDLIRSSNEIAGSNPALHEAHLQLSDDLHEGVSEVHCGLDELVNGLRETSIQGHQDPIISDFLSVAHQLPSSVGDGVSLIKKATALASVTSKLMMDLRAEAQVEHSRTGLSPAEANHRADMLEVEIRRLLATAQECANGNAQSLTHQQVVVAAAEQLIHAAHATAAPIIRARLTQGLEFATRMTASNVGPLVTVGGEVIRICPGNTHKLASNLEQLQKRVIPQVNLSCSDAREEPYDTHTQANLLAASQNLMQCLEEMLRCTDAVVPTIPDAGIQNAFSSAARNTQACLTDLRLCYGNSEQLLGTEPPEFEPTSSVELKADKAAEAQDSELWVNTLSKCNQRLDNLTAELRSNTLRLLPDETLDSICVALWDAVTRFNGAFPPLERSSSTDVDRRSWPKLPPFVDRVIQAEGKRDWNQAAFVVAELLERLTPLLQGLRGLAAFLTVAANTRSLDSNLARVLLVSHGLSSKRQSSISGSSGFTDHFTPTVSPEEQAQTTCEAMLEHLLSIGESCLNDTRELINWAMRRKSMEPRSEGTQHAAVLADQLTTSVNAVLGYVPGEVIVKRLFALLNDVNRNLRGEPQNRVPCNQLTGQPASPTEAAPELPRRQIFSHESGQELYAKLATAARRLATVCQDSTSVLSNAGKVTRDPNALGSDSQLVLLAHTADRITSTLAEVVRAAGVRGIPMETTGNLLDGLTQSGYPVAGGLRYAMRTLDTGTQQRTIEYDQSAPEVSLYTAILRLHDWAVDLSLQADTKATTVGSPNGAPDSSWLQESDSDSSQKVSRMRGQCAVALRRVKTQLLRTGSHDADASRANLCPIRLPVNSQTYPECLDSVNQIHEDMNCHVDSIPKAVSKNDTDAFTEAVKSVAQATCQLLQTTNQAAYLVGAAHPASKPGRAGRLVSSDQLAVLHDHIAAVRKGASELSRSDMPTTPDGLPSLEVMNIATNLAQRATQLCRSTRPLLSDCKNATEKKTLAESLERVARSAAGVFKSTQGNDDTGSDAIFARMKHSATQLEESVDQYADVLFRAAGGSPCQLTDNAFQAQIPILDLHQTIAQNSSELLESSHALIGVDSKEFAQVNDEFSASRQKLFDSIDQLEGLLQKLTPGLDICSRVRDDITSLLSELDSATLTITSGGATGAGSKRVETSLGLIRSGLQQVEQQSMDAADNWLHGHWELMAHNIQEAGAYLPSLVKECAQSATSLTRASEQTGLLNLARTVLEAMQQLVESLSTNLQNPSFPPVDSDSHVAEYSVQVRQACKELLSCVDAMAKLQGGLSWHIDSINAACAKLDDVTAVTVNGTSKSTSDETAVSLPVSFVQDHARLGHQSRALAETAVRLTQVAATSDNLRGGDTSAVSQSVASFAKLFIQMTETVQSIASVLYQQTEAETGSALARRLCQITQALGAASADFIRSPLRTEQYKLFNSKLDELKSALQSCARGADACATAATNMGRLVADLDTAALFARAGTLVDPESASSPSPSSYTGAKHATIAAKQCAFQSAKEAVMQATKGVVEDMQTLIKNSAGNQDALSVSAQNCLLRATELTEAVKSAASRAANVPVAPDVTNDACVESQVQLLSCSRDVARSLVQLLTHAKAVAATSYAIEAWGDSNENEKLSPLLSSHQKALNETAVNVVENISALTRSIRALSDQLSLDKPPASPSPLPTTPTTPTPPTVPPKRISLSGNRCVSKESGGGDEKSNVRASLLSVIGVLTQFEKRLASWSIENCSLKRPVTDYDYESEEGSALGRTTKPQQLIDASREITQAATKASNATGSGKLSEIASVSHLLRRTAEDLMRTLPSACQSALTSIQSIRGTEADRDVRSSVNEGVDSFADADDQLTVPSIERACRQAIEGTLNTISEMKQLTEHMETSLDTGSSSPASVQVTLAMRRLRETVNEIIEAAMKFPGSKESSSDTVLRPVKKLAPDVSPKPSCSIMLQKRISIESKETAPQPEPPVPPVRTSLLFITNQKHRAEVERSIAAANAIAPDAGPFPLQKELNEMAGELANKVQQIGQLHSKTENARRTTRVLIPAPSDQAKRLSSELETRPPNDAADPNSGMNAIISACQHLVHTTLSLMYWAAAAQRELVQQGRMKPIELNVSGSMESDSQWAQGLISAARFVAMAANCVLESAQTMVSSRMGESDVSARNPRPEMLISAAETTAGYTAHLVIACMAKADLSSVTCQGLRQAGASVRCATEELVRLVQVTVGSNGQNELSLSSFDGMTPGVVQSMREVIETKTSIAAKQRELESLHDRLKHINQDPYRGQLD